MGMCSFAIADAAAEAGAVLACGVPVAEIEPGEGVTLEDGTALRAATVICNADPKRMLGVLEGEEIDAGLPRAPRGVEDPQPGGQVQRLRWSGCRPGPRRPARTGRRGRRSTPPGRWPRRRRPSRPASAASRRSRFGEIYIQTGYDPSPAPEGKHLMSVFGQYAPYDIADGDWDSRPRRRRAPVHRPDLALRARLRGLPRRPRGARPARHRVADRAHRRQHLPGRGDARTRCGRAASPRARRCPASTCAAPPPTRPAA